MSPMTIDEGEMDINKEENPIYGILPAAFLQKLTEATRQQRMTQVIVCDEYILQELAANRPAMIEMEDAGIVVLIPMDRVTKAYEG